MDAGDSKGDSRLHLQVKNTFLDVQSTEDRPAVLKISAGWKRNHGGKPSDNEYLLNARKSQRNNMNQKYFLEL